MDYNNPVSPLASFTYRVGGQVGPGSNWQSEMASAPYRVPPYSGGTSSAQDIEVAFINQSGARFFVDGVDVLNA